MARRAASSALLTGCGMTANRCSGMPSTRAINAAALTKRSVITPIAGTPRRSAVTESCKLHDEQLPQSPIPVTTASHWPISAAIQGSAGAL